MRPVNIMMRPVNIMMRTVNKNSTERLTAYGRHYSFNTKHFQDILKIAKRWLRDVSKNISVCWINANEIGIWIISTSHFMQFQLAFVVPPT